MIIIKHWLFHLSYFTVFLFVVLLYSIRAKLSCRKAFVSRKKKSDQQKLVSFFKKLGVFKTQFHFITDANLLEENHFSRARNME